MRFRDDETDQRPALGRRAPVVLLRCHRLPRVIFSSHASEKLGQRIAGLRKAQWLTQAELAKKIGCSVEFISLVERGVNAPSVAGLEKFARVLKVAIADLFVFKQQQPTRKASPAKRA